MHAWVKNGSNYYLVDREHERLSYVDTKQRFRQFVDRNKTIIKKLIESAANGEALCSDLSNEISGIVMIRAHESKLSRFIAVSPLFQAGNIWIPSGREYDGMVEELVTFPSGANDDDVDACSMALSDMQTICYDTSFRLDLDSGFRTKDMLI
jgi:predicted phage terminase large subunit-like protein